MSTLTLSRVRPQQRRLSLSLVAGRQPALLNLPAELVFSILELSLLQSRPSTLAAVSKAIGNFVESIIYRVVVLDSIQSVALFHRTGRAKSTTFLATHVKKLVVTWIPIPHSEPCRQVWDIIVACTGLRALVLPPSYHPVTISSIISAPGRDSLCELAIATYDEMDYTGRCASLHYLPQSHPHLGFEKSSSLTHLRICEPSGQWYSPSSILESFGPLPHLAYLHLTRTSGGNEENDDIFVQDITEILYTMRELKVLAVSIFASIWGYGDEEESSIWQMLQAVAADDSRVIVLKGEYGLWKDESTIRNIVSNGPRSFWKNIRNAEIDGGKPEATVSLEMNTPLD